mgnify:FL=1
MLEEYPVADNILKRHLSLPMYYELTQKDIDTIVDVVIEGVIQLR